MLKNHIKISFRKIFKDRIFSIIKVASLAISMMCSILIFLWVMDELSFDKYHNDYDRIYRVVEDIHINGKVDRYAPICGAGGEAIRTHLPQVEYCIRTSYSYNDVIIKYQDKTFKESRWLWSEPEILQVFNIEMISGNEELALTKPQTILISETSAKKYFGDKDPLGKTLDVNGNNLEIVGVIKDCPGNTVVEYDFIASFETIKDQDKWDNWYNTTAFTYLKTKNGIDFKEFSKQIKALLPTLYEDIPGMEFRLEFALEPIHEVHLNKSLRLDRNVHGNRVYVNIFIIIGILILIIGSINFMNLATSKYINNFKEIAIRKLSGGSRKNIATQAYVESVLLSFIALNFALYAVELLLNPFNNFVNKNLDIHYFQEWYIILGLILISIIIGVLSGSYPAIFLSVVKPIDVFRTERFKNSFSAILRKVLVTFQFAISIALIIGSYVIFSQVDYMRNTNLGFEKSNKLILSTNFAVSISQNYENIKDEFLTNPDIIHVSAAASSIGRTFNNLSAQISGGDENNIISMYFFYVDDEFIDQFRIEMIAGRNFSKDILSDISSGNNETGAFILNEAAVKSLGWESPQDAIGEEMIAGGNRVLKVIGVVKDFHFSGLQNAIEPLILEFNPGSFSNINLSINPNTDKEEIIAEVKSKWKELYPNLPFDYYFLDDDFNKFYNQEDKVGKLVGLFTLFAMLVACMGLYGLTLYSTEQKTKEIGIRKVMGASIISIVVNASRNFIFLVLISNIIAWPLVYYYMNKWLQNFTYRIDMPIWSFFAAGLATIIIAQATISIQALIAANKNPVDALRYE